MRYSFTYRRFDSVGGMWVGSLDEMSDEIKTGNRFKKQKVLTF
jgi:hypothetical protein